MERTERDAHEGLWIQSKGVRVGSGRLGEVPNENEGNPLHENTVVKPLQAKIKEGK